MENRDARRLAVVVRDVRTDAAFSSLADLVDAVKARCARLRVPWTNDAINDALRLVGAGSDLLAGPPLGRRCDHKFVGGHACAKCGWAPLQMGEGPAPSKAEATATLARLGITL